MDLQALCVRLPAAEGLELRQLLDAGELFPHPASSDPPEFPQAPDPDDAKILAASQAGRVLSQ